MNRDDWSSTKPIRVKLPAGSKKRHTQTNARSSPRLRHTANVQIRRLGIDEQGRRFIQLRFYAARRWQRTLVPLDALIARRPQLFQTLHAAGLSLVRPAARNELINRIQAELPTLGLLSVKTRLGWTHMNFVLPYCAGYGQKPRSDVYLGYLDPAHIGKYRASGSLDGAQEFMTLARGNPRLMVAIAVAFAGPVLPLMAAPSFALNFKDAGDHGMASVLALASSIWGRHPDHGPAARYGFGEPWDGTIGKIQHLVEAHRHTALYLHPTLPTTAPARVRNPPPVTGQLVPRSKPAVTVACMIETSDAVAHAARTTLADAFPVVIDIPPPNVESKLAETSGTPNTTAAHTVSLGRLAAQHHGVGAREFVGRLTELWAHREIFVGEYLARRQKALCAALRKIDAEREGGRPSPLAHDAFAVTYAAACLALWLRILPWTREDLRAALFSCYREHIAYQATHPATRADPVVVVRAYIRANLGGFQQLPVEPTATAAAQSRPCPGYTGVIAGRKEYMLPAAVFDRLFTDQAEARAAKVALYQRGLLRATKSRSGRIRYVVKRQLGHDRTARSWRPYVVAIDGNILTS